VHYTGIQGRRLSHRAMAQILFKYLSPKSLSEPTKPRLGGILHKSYFVLQSRGAIVSRVFRRLLAVAAPTLWHTSVVPDCSRAGGTVAFRIALICRII
jgi:hypothetical protein